MKKIPNIFVLFIVAVLIVGSFAHSQVQAKTHIQDEPISLGLRTSEDAEPYEETENIPQAEVKNRIVIRATDLLPYNFHFIKDYVPMQHGCISVVSTLDVDTEYGANYPISLPVGTKIKNMYFTGVDFISSLKGSEIMIDVRRSHWGGAYSQLIARGSSGSMFSEAEPFNLYIPVNHTIEEGWAYHVYVTYFSVRDMGSAEHLKACQITVDYESPSPFYMAFPGVQTAP